jgi:hypothetical protein
MVRGTRVPFGGGVDVMGIVGVTTLHPREMGKPGLPPPPHPHWRLCCPHQRIPREWHAVTVTHYEQSHEDLGHSPWEKGLVKVHLAPLVGFG